MRLLVSCNHNGSVKEIVCNKGTDTSIQTALQPFSIKTNLIGKKNSGTVSQMIAIDGSLLLVARDSGVVELYESKLKSIEYDEMDGEQEDLRPRFNINDFNLLGSVDGLLDDSKLEIISKKSAKRTKIYDTFVSLSQLSSKKLCFLLGTKSGLIHIIEIEKNQTLKVTKTHELKAPMDFLQIYDNESNEKECIFAYGGEENLVKLIKLSNNFTQIEKIWEAKNVANDRLDMRVPVWPTALKFLDPIKSDKIDSSKLNYQFIVVTHWAHLGIYQTQHGRKPLHYIDLLPNREPLANLEMVADNCDDLTPEGNLKSSDINNFTFVSTDFKKNVLRFNNKGRLITKFGRDDIVGTPYFIKVINEKYLVQGGVDRYVRVFDLQSARRIAKIYVTGKCNNVIMLDDNEIEIPIPAQEKKKAEQIKKRRQHQPENETEQDVEELWDQLESSTKTKKVKN